jgi:hypothetical protein
LQALIDRQAISDCLLRYTRGVDRVDEDLIRSAFFPDAIDYHPATSAGDIEDFLATWLPRQSGRHLAQHYITNQSIDLDGDQAHVETYWLCVVKQLDSEAGDALGGRYLDRFERREGEWRIAKRVVVPEWHSRLDFAPMRRPTGTEHWTRRDRRDLSYSRPLVDPPPVPE